MKGKRIWKSRLFRTGLIFELSPKEFKIFKDSRIPGFQDSRAQVVTGNAGACAA
jgi:hypothetical protein